MAGRAGRAGRDGFLFLRKHEIYFDVDKPLLYAVFRI